MLFYGTCVISVHPGCFPVIALNGEDITLGMLRMRIVHHDMNRLYSHCMLFKLLICCTSTRLTPKKSLDAPVVHHRNALILHGRFRNNAGFCLQTSAFLFYFARFVIYRRNKDGVEGIFA